VKLTGITSILGKKNALFEITEPGGKQPKKPILTEGERLDTLEDISIDVDNNVVKARIGDAETNLTFAKIEQPAAPAPAAPGAPGVPGFTPPIPRIPGTPGAPSPTLINPANPTSSTSSGAGRSAIVVMGGGDQSSSAPGATPYGTGTGGISLGGAAPVTPAYGTAPTVPGRFPTAITPNITAPNPAGATAVPGLRSIPTRQIRTDQPQGKPMTREEIDLLIEAKREDNRGKNLPPLPPTSLSHLIDPTHPDVPYLPPSARPQ
jgi:hypothetical protein